MPAQMPIAVGSCWRGNAVTMIESESGFIIAAPTPWQARNDDQLGVGRRERAARPRRA